MKHVIVGTAGHVDHGKTLLIKALTGIDTDRLKEEKKRGITIELGFAWLDLPGGDRAGIVDVPGHEKFIANMLAGAGGVDLALLVVAADDGVMPQTREHLGILSLLGIGDGIIVVTKADLVEPEWIELVKEDIKKLAEGTFLEGAPILAVSAYTGQGLEELTALIAQKAQGISQRSAGTPFRVPVDRVFSVEGFGTVITGTMIEGRLAEGDEVEVYPGGRRARVRNLQVHSQDVDEAFAGQRVAVNLAGLPREEIARGDTLAVPGSMENTMMLDVKLRILPDSGRTIENGSRLHFYHGARESLCKVVLLDTDRLAPGQEGYAQLRLEEEVAAKMGDRFVVRFYSPVETVGGGRVLDPHPPKRRRHHSQALEALRVREEGSPGETLFQAVADSSATLLPLAEIGRRLGMGQGDLARELETLRQEGRVFSLGERNAVSAAFVEKTGGTARSILEEYHRENPLQAGMRRDELRSRILPGRDIALADKLLELLATQKIIRLDNRTAALPDFASQGGREQELAAKVEAAFLAGGFAPPTPEELAAKFPGEKNLRRATDALLAAGALLSTAPGMFFHAQVVAQAREKVAAAIAAEGSVTLAQFRDATGTSRKFALSLLEYFDRHGFTKKVGDARVLAKK